METKTKTKMIEGRRKWGESDVDIDVISGREWLAVECERKEVDERYIRCLVDLIEVDWGGRIDRNRRGTTIKKPSNVQDGIQSWIWG